MSACSSSPSSRSNIVTGYTGQISIGQGAFMAVGGYATAILTHDHGWNDLATLPVAALVGFAAGIVVGLPALRLPRRLPGPDDVRRGARRAADREELPELHRRDRGARAPDAQRALALPDGVGDRGDHVRARAGSCSAGAPDARSGRSGTARSPPPPRGSRSRSTRRSASASPPRWQQWPAPSTSS